MSNQSAGLGVLRPIRVWAFKDAMDAAVSSASGRFLPWVSREAPGSSAPLH
jgi:hypothetical protein